MKITRRQLLKGAAIAGVGATLPMVPFKWMMRDAYAFYQSPATIPLFGTTLRGIGTIGVAASDGVAPLTGVKHYTIDIDQYTDAGVCPALGPTTLRGYNPANLLAGQKNRHLSGIILAKKGEPIQITFRNNIPAGKHIIPNDTTIPGANQATNRTAIHFHGGLIPWISDGGPFDWWTKEGAHGISFLNNDVLAPGNVGTNKAEYFYTLNQSARFGWYHDHAFGITRINAYAGMATGLFIRDDFEAGLIDGSGGVAQGLPGYIEAGGNEIPLVFQDKIFVGSNIKAFDPTWSTVSSATTPGSLWYAHIYERNRWRATGSRTAPPNPSCIPEFFGDTMLVNGTTFPKATVQARRYRLRLLNACNARFLNLQLYVANGTANGITLDSLGNPTNAPALCDPNTPGVSGAETILQIGTEGGFLPFPVKVPTSVPFDPVTLTGSLIVAPAERPDLLIDFSAYAGQSIILYSDAPAPFPGGDPRTDYFPGWNTAANPTNALTPAGFGPNSRILMRFDVVAASLPADPPLTITTATDLRAGNDTFLNPLDASFVRPLTLNEAFDKYGRLIQMLGTTAPNPTNTGFGLAYQDTATETPQDGATEIWEIYNTTADVHPMHFHLVNVQVLNRQNFVFNNGLPTPSGSPIQLNPNETGWKETVPMYPGTVTRILMKFDLSLAKITGPDHTPIDLTFAGGTADGDPPPSPRTGGAEYVWHCHILEHEEHDMMRPLVVGSPV